MNLPIIPTRECGECTACCNTHEIKALKKPAGTPCSLCVENQGCGDYDDRPQICREYSCSWLSGNWPDEARPDLFGVVIDVLQIEFEGSLYRVYWFWEVFKDDNVRDRIARTKKTLAAKGHVSAYKRLDGTAAYEFPGEGFTPESAQRFFDNLEGEK